MRKIRLEDAKIEYNGEWFSVDDLKNMVQEKMHSGDMKFADLADTLEELNNALEKSHTLETHFVISNQDYGKLKSLCKSEDDNICVRRAIMAYIGKAASEDQKGKATVKCSKCKEPIVIPSSERPIVVKCPKCGTNCRLTL
ncbi:MAG: hypothetical protein JRF40_11875 [Deltaproteobacteria bacterium]|nr:hypothetical protein [Deltaproteobacteria bacterium]MBW2220172.1 hypothetical protein [Deltaproteobacteria bacterium]